MKKTKFEILIFICMILLGLGCFLIATKNNQYNFSRIFYHVIPKRILQELLW